MSNDGKLEKITFTEDQIRCFRDFDSWDVLPNAVKEANYKAFIEGIGASTAVNALHLHLKWKEQGRA